MDFRGILYLGLLLSLYIFPGRRKASHFIEKIFSPRNHDFTDSFQKFRIGMSGMIENNFA
jgi:hypothetical protein